MGTQIELGDITAEVVLKDIMEPTHNARFIALMDQFMPKWQFYRDQLNRLPVSHEDWVY